MLQKTNKKIEVESDTETKIDETVLLDKVIFFNKEFICSIS